MRRMNLPILTLESAPADSRSVLEGIAADIGVIPNLAATAAASPALLAGFDGMRRAVASTKVDPVLRELAGLTVGVAVDNRYGVAFHSTMLAGLGVDERDIAAVRDGRPPSGPPAAVATYHLVREAVLERGKVAEATIAAAADSGLTTETILELVLECAFAALVGVIDNLAGHVELDAFLAPRAWPDGD